MRATVLVLGLVLFQFVLFGPSLLGMKVLLPLDILDSPGMLNPHGGQSYREPWDEQFLDLVLLAEPDRRFAIRELRAGRLPLWTPSAFCGTPFVAMNITSVFSPFRLIEYASENPIVLAWSQLAKALVAGIGAYLFFRLALRVSYWPAVTGAWAFPLTGAMIFWSQYTLATVFLWLPWLLLFVIQTVRRPGGWAPLGVAVMTCLVLLSGHSAVAAHVLLASGMVALWSVWDVHCRGKTQVAQKTTGGTRNALVAIAAIGAGWAVGIALSMPQTLPTLDYLHEGYRLMSRAAGHVETPSVGAGAVTALFLPYSRGASHLYAAMSTSGNLQESPASGYAGLLLVLVASPFGFMDPRRRNTQWFWLVLAIVTASQTLGIPGLAWVFNHRPLSLLRNNRFVMVSGFAMLTMAVLGLDVLMRGIRRVSQKGGGKVAWWWPLFLLLPIGLCLWSLSSALWLPTDLAKAIADRIASPGALPPLSDPDYLDASRNWFESVFFCGAALAGLGAAMLIAAVWIHTRRPELMRTFCVVLIGGALAEMTFNAFDFNRQCDWADYYPSIVALDQVAKDPDFRAVGVQCLAPNLAQVYSLRDVRGYDANDPYRINRLMELFRDPSSKDFTYARTLGWVPRYSPLAHLMGIKYLIYRGEPPSRIEDGQKKVDPSVKFVSDDYWVREDPLALPRVSIPGRVFVFNEEEVRLKALSDPRFDPRIHAVVESETPTGLENHACHGQAKIVTDSVQTIRVEYDMQTPGMLLMTDRFDPGWQAKVDGQIRPILAADEAFRGVLLPAGKGTVEFTYEAPAFYGGLKVAGTALALLVIWAVWRVAVFRAGRYHA